MVEPGGTGDTAKDNLGGYLVGGQEEATGREEHAGGPRYGGEDRGGRRVGVWRC